MSHGSTEITEQRIAPQEPPVFISAHVPDDLPEGFVTRDTLERIVPREDYERTQPVNPLNTTVRQGPQQAARIMNAWNRLLRDAGHR